MAAYYRPDTLGDALEILAQHPATIVAGCSDIFPATQAAALQGPVLDITGVAQLRGVRACDDAIHIGATTRWSDIIAAPLPPAFDMLKQAAREIGSVQIQNAATIAGNLCNASPAADGVPCLLALDAEVAVQSRREARHAPLNQFLTGPRQTTLRPDEMVTGLRIPVSATAGRSDFQKLGARKYLVISIAMVASRLEIENGRVAQAAIAVGACTPVATRLTALEQALTGQATGAGLAERATDALIFPALDPIGDIRADAPYRRRAAAELVRQSLRSLAAPVSAVPT